MNSKDFSILKRRTAGNPLIYFDNAATAQKPEPVVRAVTDFYRNHNANVHRALNPLAEEATRLYDEARGTVASFISADRDEIVFTRGATESINIVARSWGQTQLRRGDLVILSRAEHHANIVPWLQLKERIGIRISYIPLRRDGSLDISAASALLAEPDARLLAVTHASNVLGVINPVEKLFRLARKNGLTTLIDASQTIAHRQIDVRRIGCDFLAFSGHKIGGPTGIGVLYGRRDILAAMPPFIGGGDMIEEVHEDGFTAAEPPLRFEAGTPHIAGAIGLGAACRYLEKVGWEKIERAEAALCDEFLAQHRRYPFIKLIGTASPRLPIFSLHVDGVHPHDAADLLGQQGIMLRAGRHCAQPLHEYLGLGATLRASLCFYNSPAEIRTFFRLLAEVRRRFSE